VIPAGVEIFVSLVPIDLRWGFDRLAGMVDEHLGHCARSGALFVFFGKRKTALKILFFDGTGLCQFYKRLDRATFRVPTTPVPEATYIELSEHELDALLDAIDLKPPRRSRRARLH